MHVSNHEPVSFTVNTMRRPVARFARGGERGSALAAAVVPTIENLFKHSELERNPVSVDQTLWQSSRGDGKKFRPRGGPWSRVGK